MRSQYLSYKLLDTSLLNPVERSLLQVITVRPEYCLENLATIAASINRSIRTVQRAIDTLLQKGIITKKYTTFKRMILRVVSIEDQDKLASGGLITQVLKFCKFAKSKKKRPDMTLVSGIDTTSVSESIKSSNKENSILNTLLKKNDFKGKNLEEEKKSQLEAYKKFLADSLN